MTPEVSRVAELLTLLRQQGVGFTFVQVGEIKIVCAPPAAEKPAAPRLPTTAMVEQDNLAAARCRGRVLFGRELSDAELTEMQGAL